MAEGAVTEILPPVGTVEVVILLSPVRAPDGSLRCQRITAEAEQPLSAYIPAGMRVYRLVRSGTVVAAEDWDTARAHHLDEICLIPQLGFVGGSLATILIGALVSIAIGLAVTALTYLIFPQQQTKIENKAEDPVFGWEGIRTTRGPGGEVTLTYGRHRIGGQLLSAYVETQLAAVDSGTTPIVRTITNVTGGIPDLSNPLGGSPITVTAPNHGLQASDTPTLAGITGKLNANSTWGIFDITTNTFSLQNSYGIDHRDYTGGGTATTVPPQVKAQAVEQSPTLTMIIALGEGPIATADTGTVEFNGQPTANFPGVQFETRQGEANQTPITWATETRNTFSTPPAGGSEITSGGGITYTTNTAVTSFILGIEFRDGLIEHNTKGEHEENWTEWRYRYRVSPAGAWSPYTTFTVHGKRLSRVFFAARRDNLALNTYDINLEFVNARVMDVNRSRWKPYLGTVTEIQAGTEAYPNTALLAIRAIATEQLQGAIPNVTIVVNGLLIRTGSFTASRVYSDNPAWCIMDLLTHPRYGLGFPDGTIDLPSFAVAASYCDEQIHGERRHTFHWVLSRETRAQDVILEMCNAARLVLLRTEGKWVLRPTFNSVPVQLLNWASCTNVKLNYTRDPDRINVIEGRFADETQGWETNVLTWPPVEEWPTQPRKTSIELRGITKPSRVLRALQYELKRRQLPRLTLEMECAMDALRLQAHDLFMFSHPLPGWGFSGRIVASTTTVVTVDEEVTFQAGFFWHIYIRHDDDVIELKPLNNPGNVTTRVLNIEGGFALSKAATPRTSSWAVGKSTPVDTAVRVLRVATMERMQEQMVRLQAVQHNPTIYDDIDAAPPPVITTLFNPLGPPPPLIHLTAQELVRIDVSGISRKVVHLSWTIGPVTSSFAPYGGAIIFRRDIRVAGGAGIAVAGTVALGALVGSTDPGGDYTRLTDVGATVFEYDDGTVITGGVYEYKVVPISGQGVPNNQGAWIIQIGVGGGTTPEYYPDMPTNLRLKDQAVGQTVFQGLDAHFVWDPPANPGLVGDTNFVNQYRVEIWAPTSAYVMRGGLIQTDTQFVYTFAMNGEDNTRAGFAGPRRDFLIKVWSKTTVGRESLLPAILSVTNAIPDMSGVLADMVPLVEGLEVEWDHWIPPFDITRYDVRLDAFTPPSTIVASLLSVFGTTAKRTIIPNLNGGVTYYAQILPYDPFGAGIPSGIASAAPLTPAQAWNFFVRDFVPVGIEFVPNPETNTLTWSAGTLNYIDDFGQAQSKPIAAGTTSFGAVTQFVFYVLGDEAFATSTGITGALGPNKAIMAVYNGGNNLVVLWGKAKVHGSDIIANSIGANQLVVANAIITQSAQLANAIIQNAHLANVSVGTAQIQLAAITSALIANLAVTDSHILNLSADKILAGTLNVLLNIGVGNNVQLSGPNQNMAVLDQTGIIRVLLGKIGTGPQDYGLQIRNAANALIYDLNGLGVNTVSTATVQGGAITQSASAETLATLAGTGETELSFLPTTISVTDGLTYIFAQVTITVDSGSAAKGVIVRIRKNSVTGPVLATVTSIDTNTATVNARDITPASTQTYHLTGAGIGATDYSVTERRVYILNAKR